MAGLEVVGLIVALFPIVKNAVGLYKAASEKPTTVATRLEMKIDIEEIIFEQFARKLLRLAPPGTHIDRMLDKNSPDFKAWDSDELQKVLQQQLGKRTTARMVSLLEQLHDLLASLRATLNNINRGTVRCGQLHGHISKEHNTSIDEY